MVYMVSFKTFLNKNCSLLQTEIYFVLYNEQTIVKVLQNLPLSIMVILHFLFKLVYIQISKIKTFLIDSQPEERS